MEMEVVTDDKPLADEMGNVIAPAVLSEPETTDTLELETQKVALGTGMEIETQIMEEDLGDVIDNREALPCSEFPVNQVAQEPSSDVDLVQKDKPGTVEGEKSEAKALEKDISVPAENDGIVCFVNQDAKITPSAVIQYVLDTELPYDTVLSCTDGKLGCHRIVLASASPFIADTCTDHRLGEIVVIIIPDIPVAIMKTLLGFCYTGKMFFRKEDQQAVYDAMKCLFIGEYGELSVKTVTVKATPPPEPPQPEPVQAAPHPAQATANPAENPAEQIDETPVPATAWTAEDLSYSTDEEDEEEDENKDESSDDNEDDNFQPSEFAAHEPGPEEEDRIAFANSFMRNRKPTGNADQNHIRYLIGHREEGSKTRKLWCNHCPAAFKSVETLSEHLDNTHGLDLEPRNLTKTEFRKLTKCNLCNTRFPNVPSTTSCLQKHHYTRCYLCLEIYKTKEFEDHVKEHHVVEEQKSVCVVKCRWCQAGLLLQQNPLDNKQISAHCFSHHVPSGKTQFPIDDDEKPGGKSAESVQLPEYLQQQQMQAKEEAKPVFASIFARQTGSAAASSKSKDVKKDVHSASTSKSFKKSGPPPSATKKEEVPAVLAMLHQASLKRKLSLDPQAPDSATTSPQQQTQHPKKRARLDSNGWPPQVAKRTGKPVGRMVDLARLEKGIPSFVSRKDKQKNPSITLDIGNLPENYVKIGLTKTFIHDLAHGKQELAQDIFESLEFAESFQSADPGHNPSPPPEQLVTNPKPSPDVIIVESPVDFVDLVKID